MSDLAAAARPDAAPEAAPEAAPAIHYDLPQPSGTHLLVDCRHVSREVCLDDAGMLRGLAMAAQAAGANVINQVRYRFGADSPPGFTCAVVLDESHCTAHSYADHGMIAIDVFTCGSTDPADVLAHLRQRVDLGEVTVTSRARFGAA